jgi:hypothetical protein
MKQYLSIFIFLILVASGYECFSQVEIKKELKQKIEDSTEKIAVWEPDFESPVSFNAKAVWSNDKKQLAVVMKVKVLDGWHIYASVPETQPYIESKIELSVPDGMVPLGDWQLPNAYPSYDDDVYIYKGSFTFVQYFAINKPLQNNKISVGLYYQCCDINQCLPPTLETVEISLK